MTNETRSGGQVSRAVSALIVVVVFVVTGARTAVTSVPHGYDRAGAASRLDAYAGSDTTVQQGFRGNETSIAKPRNGYDDASNLARTPARPNGYGSAPNTADDLARLPVGRERTAQRGVMIWLRRRGGPEPVP